jgi:hypothetical protein
LGTVVDRAAGEAPPARDSRILAASSFPAPQAKPAKPLPALPRDSHHDQQRNRRLGEPIMTAEMLWAAPGLASAADHDDALAPIFALDHAREIYLIEHGPIETGVETALRLR